MAHPNLIRFAQRLIDGDCKMVWLGDSLSSETNDNRWPESVLKTFDIPWQGRYVPAGTASAIDNGVQNYSMTSNLVSAASNMEDGSANPLPHNIWEEQRLDNKAQGISTRRWLITDLNEYKRGPWTDGQDLTVRALFWDGANGIGGRYRVSQNSSGVDASDNDYSTAAGFAQGSTIKTLDIAISPHPGGTDTTWDFVCEGSNSVDETTGLQACAGALFYRTNATKGLQLGVLASGGFDSHDHRSSLSTDPSYHAEGQWSDIQLQNYCRYQRSLNTAVISIVNTSSTETSSGSTLRDEFRSNLEYIIERWRTAMWRAAALNDDLNGFEPMFFLLAPWTVVNTTTTVIRDEWYNAALALQDAYPDVSTLYMNPILDDWFNDTWSNWNGTYLSDTTHQAAAGIEPFGNALFAELRAAFLEGRRSTNPNLLQSWRRAQRVGPGDLNRQV